MLNGFSSSNWPYSSSRPSLYQRSERKWVREYSLPNRCVGGIPSTRRRRGVEPAEPASPTGWTSEIVNSQKLKAYDLTASYVNFRTGSGAALDAEVASSIRRGKPVLFYYWSPTPLLGRFKLVKLEEPPFDAQAWKTLADANNPNPKGTRSMPASLAIGVSAPFKAQYPDLVAFFEKVDLPIDLLNQTLGQMSEKRQPPRQVAEAFLRDQPQVWKGWVPGEVASKVSASL